MITLLLFATCLQTPAQTELPAIPKFLQVSPEFCTGAQPRLEAFAKLKADGVKAVLNLRQPSEHRAADEQAAVEAAGMKYFNIPVVYRDPTDAEVDAFLKITDDPANRPMFIHCTAAIRVGRVLGDPARAARRAHVGRRARRRPEGRTGQRAAPRRVRAQVHRVASTQEVARWCGRRLLDARRSPARQPRCRAATSPRERTRRSARRGAVHGHFRRRGPVPPPHGLRESDHATRPHDCPSHRRAPGH